MHELPGIQWVRRMHAATREHADHTAWLGSHLAVNFGLGCLPDVERGHVSNGEAAIACESDGGGARRRGDSDWGLRCEPVHRVHEKLGVIAGSEEARLCMRGPTGGAPVRQRGPQDGHGADVVRVRPAAVGVCVSSRAAGGGGRFTLDEDDGGVDARSKDGGAARGDGEGVDVGLVLLHRAQRRAELRFPELNGASRGA